MRTTLNLEDEVLEQVKRYAEDRSLALGKAVSDLIRRGLETPTPTRVLNGVIVFDVLPDSPPVTSKRVKDLEAEDD